MTAYYELSIQLQERRWHGAGDLWDFVRDKTPIKVSLRAENYDDAAAKAKTLLPDQPDGYRYHVGVTAVTELNEPVFPARRRAIRYRGA